MIYVPVTEPAAIHHIGQAVQAAIAAEAARQLATYGSLPVFRLVHGDPSTWCAADFDAWLEQSDAALAKEGQR